MRPSECRPGCHFCSDWRHKRAPRLPYWPKYPCCLWIYLFPCETPQGNHLSNSETLISCEIYMQREVMKRCICAVAFPLRSADLQYKVKHTPWCQSFDWDGWSHCGCNKIKIPVCWHFCYGDSVTSGEFLEVHNKKRLRSCRMQVDGIFYPPGLCSVNWQATYSWESSRYLNQTHTVNANNMRANKHH